jgi:hypothetical protein
LPGIANIEKLVSMILVFVPQWVRVDARIDEFSLGLKKVLGNSSSEQILFIGATTMLEIENTHVVRLLNVM